MNNPTPMDPVNHQHRQHGYRVAPNVSPASFSKRVHAAGQCWAVAALCLLPPLPALAAPEVVKVARISVLPAEEGWQAVEAQLEGVKVEADHTNPNSRSRLGMHGTLESRTKVLTLRSAEGQALAVVLVYATYGAARNLVTRGNCPSIPGLYVRDFTGGRQESPECLVMGGPYPSDMLLTRALHRLAEARTPPGAGSETPHQAYFVNASFANSTGESIVVQGLLAPTFEGLAGASPVGTVPPNLPPQVAAWGDALGDAARQAMRSLGGQMALPPVTFR